ncbi:Protein CHROMATIN REMODELING 19 [Lathyrus oleraceus]|uniref:Protein CHROMATIN REMODELING 19 n=1 Tax=Pisum sativum TaxID=3888 RepID=A0A9D4VI67_PEA|nr:Protein CHROMATIN REMODELING 19 [Pisum sativum]KAI5383120.1 Protein CHROMATIN REMODELING 19 [Pisum sativum]KAI5383125.1 Protein CHROMATIN REMODELING 19 [Pisum sativum]
MAGGCFLGALTFLAGAGGCFLGALTFLAGASCCCFLGVLGFGVICFEGAASLTLTVGRLQYKSTREPARTAYCKELNSLSKAGLPPPFNVLLVCYSLFERHSPQQKDDRKILKRWKWSCVLMDEAHALKDKNSFRWKNLMSVARNANQRLMLTGTPLRNDLHELWSMLEFMMPDVLASEDVDLKKLLSAEDTDLISRMKSILEPFILRRLKSDVIQQLIQKNTEG